MIFPTLINRLHVTTPTAAFTAMPASSASHRRARLVADAKFALSILAALAVLVLFRATMNV